MRALIRAGARLVVPALAILIAGCGDAALKDNSLGPITNIVAAVSSADGTVSASLLDGDRPANGSGPVISVSGFATAVNGGSIRASVTSPTAFDRVLVSLVNFDGYYQLDLPAPTTATDVVVTLSPDAPDASMALVYNASVGGGPVGNALMQSVNLIRVGSGDVQVSVVWDAPTDVDLHVTDPSGEEIYFGNTSSASGGTLDLDSNAACAIDNVNNENIVWPTGTAPSGTYDVNLVYWSACSQPQTNYTVTIAVQGQPPQIFSGTLITANANTKIPIGSFTR